MKNSSKLKWQNENLDRIYLCVPKGRKAKIRAHAEIHHENISQFIKRAIREAMERDKMFAELKERIAASAEEHGVTIANETELKRLAESFAVLEPYLPDIQEDYFKSRCPKKDTQPIFRPMPLERKIWPKRGIGSMCGRVSGPEDGVGYLNRSS